MKKFAHLFIALLFVFFSQKASAQDDSCHVKISVLTCSSGEEAYANFGHTAIRIVDSTNHTDFVFNYGTFDFDDPNFLVKFIRGNLDYFLSVNSYENFILEYQYDKRSVYEQELRLNCKQKNAIIASLQKNITGNNRYYKYKFLNDNCTSGIRDLIFDNVKAAYTPNPIVSMKTTYRDLLHVYLDKDGKPWTKLGIDILLGPRTDKPLGTKQSMFLPDYLMRALDSSKIKDTTPLVLKEGLLLTTPPLKTASNNNLPLIITITISLFVIVFSFIKTKWAIIAIRIFDVIFLFITGVLGILLLLLWFGSEHIEMRDNFNVFWALPTNILGMFFIWTKRKDLKKYFISAAVLTALLVLTWFIIPQHLNIAVFPVAIAALVRYILLAKK